MVSLWEVTARNPAGNALDLLDGQGTKTFCAEPAAGGQLAGDLRLIDALGGRETLEFNEQVGQCQRPNANNRQRDANQSRKATLFDRVDYVLDLRFAKGHIIQKVEAPSIADGACGG